MSRQLRYFVAIAEGGSITRPAHAPNVAQPSLSVNLRTMEKPLGVSLLFRTSVHVHFPRFSYSAVAADTGAADGNAA